MNSNEFPLWFASGQAHRHTQNHGWNDCFPPFSAASGFKRINKLVFCKSWPKPFASTTLLQSKNTPSNIIKTTSNYYRHAAHICMDNLLLTCQVCQAIYGIWTTPRVCKEGRQTSWWLNTKKTKHAHLKLACHQKCLDFENYAHLLLGFTVYMFDCTTMITIYDCAFVWTPYFTKMIFKICWPIFLVSSLWYPWLAVYISVSYSFFLDILFVEVVKKQISRISKT